MIDSKPFENLVDYILLLKDSDALAEQIVDGVANERLAEEFEEAIDALVYELYFEEDFRKQNVSLLEHAAKIFPAFADADNAETKANKIRTAYQNLKNPNGDFRQNLLLMDERLNELLAPIWNS